MCSPEPPSGAQQDIDANGSSAANSPDVSRPLDLHETENHDVISLHTGFPCVSVFVRELSFISTLLSDLKTSVGS